MDLVVQILLVTHTQLWDLCVLALEHLSCVLQYLNVRLVGAVLTHRLQEGIAHCSNVRAFDRGICGSLVVFAARVLSENQRTWIHM